MARSGLFGASGALSRFRGIEMSAVRPVLVSMLARIIESVRMPTRSAPASEPSSRMLTRACSAHGSSPSETWAPAPGVVGVLPKTCATVLCVIVAYSANLNDEPATRKTMRVVKPASRRVRARSSLVGRVWTAVRMIEPHQRMPPTTKATASACSTVGRATIDSAAFVTPVRIT